MSEFGLENATPFAAGTLLLADEEGRPLLVAIVKATYTITPGMPLRLAEEQAPVNPAGVYNGKPGVSSLRYEPEVAFVKPSTDIALVGSAHAPRGGVTELDVEFRVGAIAKIVKVVGPRMWASRFGFTSLTRPIPFEKMPLTWERAFGGWDRHASDQAKHTFEARNPVGIGFHAKGAPPVDQSSAPNLEDPGRPIRDWNDVPAPAGFGFIGPEWQPRASFAGTYDDAWAGARAPLLPKDFDRRFFNAAAPGLVAPGYLRGDEPVLVRNVTREGTLSFALPGVAPPRARLEQRQGEDVEITMRIDTVVVDTDAWRVFLIWRGHAALPDGPLGVNSVVTEAAAAAA